MSVVRSPDRFNFTKTVTSRLKMKWGSIFSFVVSRETSICYLSTMQISSPKTATVVLARTGYYLGDCRVMIFLNQSSFLHLLASLSLSSLRSLPLCLCHTHTWQHVHAHFLHHILPQTGDIWFLHCVKHIIVNCILIILLSPVNVPNLSFGHPGWHHFLAMGHAQAHFVLSLFLDRAHFSTGLWFFWVQNAN